MFQLVFNALHIYVHWYNLQGRVNIKQSMHKFYLLNNFQLYCTTEHHIVKICKFIRSLMFQKVLKWISYQKNKRYIFLPKKQYLKNLNILYVHFNNEQGKIVKKTFTYFSVWQEGIWKNNSFCQLSFCKCIHRSSVKLR